MRDSHADVGNEYCVRFITEQQAKKIVHQAGETMMCF